MPLAALVARWLFHGCVRGEGTPYRPPPQRLGLRRVSGYSPGACRMPLGNGALAQCVMLLCYGLGSHATNRADREVGKPAVDSGPSSQARP